jgi:hypothetical protein
MFRGRLEPPTSGFSDQRSNQLSYLNCDPLLGKESN